MVAATGPHYFKRLGLQSERIHCGTRSNSLELKLVVAWCKACLSKNYLWQERDSQFLCTPTSSSCVFGMTMHCASYETLRKSCKQRTSKIFRALVE